MRTRRRRLTAVGLVALIGVPSGTAAARAPDPRLMAGFEQAYNLDHDGAIATFRQAVAADPDDPAAHRAIAAATWLRVLFLRGAMMVDTYVSGSVGRTAGDFGEPPADLDALFTEHSERAVALAEAAVDRAPDDPSAHYELGVAVALVASYRATIGGEPIGALRDARRAYAAHERVLELDPSRDDAKLLLGVYRYVVSILPRAFRMMAYLVGFDGGKTEAIDMVGAAAAYPGETQAEARFALVLLFNREGDYGRAQRVLSDLRRDYPRNRLVWLETAATWIRDDRPAMAALALEHGFARLQADDRIRMAGEDAVWHLKRGTARAALGLDDLASLDLRRAAGAGAPAWVAGRAHLELGKLADLAGDRADARRRYDKSRDLCDDARDRACERAADRYRETPYTGR